MWALWLVAVVGICGCWGCWCCLLGRSCIQLASLGWVASGFLGGSPNTLLGSPGLPRNLCCGRCGCSGLLLLELLRLPRAVSAGSSGGAPWGSLMIIMYSGLSSSCPPPPPPLDLTWLFWGYVKLLLGVGEGSLELRQALSRSLSGLGWTYGEAGRGWYH